MTAMFPYTKSTKTEDNAHLQTQGLSLALGPVAPLRKLVISQHKRPRLENARHDSSDDDLDFACGKDEKITYRQLTGLLAEQAMLLRAEATAAYSDLRENFHDVMEHANSSTLIHSAPGPEASPLLDPSIPILPWAVVAALRHGWIEHIPLTALTSSACSVASVLQSLPLDPSQEHKITMFEWYQASRNFVYAISCHLFAKGDSMPGGPAAQKISAAFANHFRAVESKANFETHFHLYVEYDITIRLKYLHLSGLFNPSDFQHATFNAILDAATDAKLRELAECIGQFPDVAPHPVPGWHPHRNLCPYLEPASQVDHR